MSFDRKIGDIGNRYIKDIADGRKAKYVMYISRMLV